MNSEPFYMVWRIGGRSPVKIHNSFEEAEQECERLCKKEHDKFYVLQAVLAVEPAKKFVKTRLEVTPSWDDTPYDAYDGEYKL